MLPMGSPTTKAPSEVGRKPSVELSGSVTVGGWPEYVTTAVNGEPAAIWAAGVMRSFLAPYGPAS